MDQIAVQVLPILLAITLHEYAHGWVARKLGDRTAELGGRLTLNPLAHVDPVGTVIFPAMQYFLTNSIFFGWAKPVPVNPSYFANPRRGMMWVALGGPAANLIQMAIAGVMLHGLVAFQPQLPTLLFSQTAPQGLGQSIIVPISLMLIHAVHFNALIMAFNLIPIPPLDGSRVAYALLPIQVARKYATIERYGMILIFGLLFLFPGFLHAIIGPVRRLALALVGFA